MKPFIRQKKWHTSSLFLFIAFVSFSLNVNGQAFRTTWVTTDGQITIPTTGAGYNYNISWNNLTNGGVGDGSITGQTGNYTINGLANGDTYQVEITGVFPRIYFNNTGDKDKILTVEQWGDIAWANMAFAFYGCTNLTVPASDAPDLSSVISLKQMFQGASSFNESIDHWNVSTIGEFYGMFWDATSFNQSLNSWNMSNAYDISSMFQGATSFNQPLDNWIISGITDVKVMFKNASNFNQSVNHFDVSMVSDFAGTFEGATAFDQPLDNWNVSSATSMALMFFNASSFNQPISSWDVSGVANFSYMFNNATSFDQSLGSWDISSATNMADMLWLSNLSVTNYDNTLTGWVSLDVGETQIPTGITSFRSNGLAYCNGETARQDLITTYSWAISLDIKNCTPFTTTWQTTDGTITIPTTGGGYSYDIAWTNLTNGGVGDGSITGQTGDYTINSLQNGDIYQVEITGVFPRIFFNNAGDKDKILTVEAWGDIEWTSMNGAFWGCTNLTVPAVDAPDLTNAISLQQMFEGATSFNESIDHWDVSTIESFYGMFWDATSFNQSLNSWNIASATDISHMFNGATSFNQPLDNWVTTGITEIKLMFKNASSFNQSVNHFDVSLVSDFSGTFEGATSFNQPLNNWNTGSATLMDLMFYNNTAFNQPIDSWDISGVMDMGYMFANATNFNQNLGSWDISSVTNMADILWLTNLSTANYDNTLIGWATLDVGETQIPTGITLFRANGLTYCSGSAARQDLIDNYSWAITLDTYSCSQFITTWVTTDGQITIPTTGGGYNYDIVWTNLTNTGVGDGSITGQTGDYTITGLENNSTYQIEISGTFPQIHFNNSGDKDKIMTIENWGTISWTSMASAFNGCTNLTYNAADAPDLSLVNDMSYMFSGASSFNGNISSWDVSNVQNFSFMFFGAAAFDQPLDGWVVTSANNMQSMFQNASAFNQNLNSWSPANVITMQSMFQNATSFNGQVDGWDITSLDNAVNLFNGATSFNQTVESWDVTGVTDVSGMFSNATVFNQPLNGWGTKTSLINDMGRMFQNATAFDQPLDAWDVSSAQHMSYMFAGASSFNRDLDSWVPSSCLDIQQMFDGATSFNGALNGWGVNTALITNMQQTFYNAVAFNQPLDSWDVSSVQTMDGMFQNATVFDQNLNSWTTTSCQNMARMFQNAVAFDGAIDNWNLSLVTNITSMFSGATSFNQPIGNWGANTGLVQNMVGVFFGATAFNQPLDSWDVGSVTNMQSMFRDAVAFNQDLSSWNTSSVNAVLGMYYMFSGATSFNGDITTWDVSNNQSFQGMFLGATSFDQNLGAWDISSGASINFGGTSMSTANYDATLIGWLDDNGGTETIPTGFTVNATGINYCASETDRQTLITTYSWTINDAGIACPYEVTNTNDSGIGSLRWCLDNAIAMAGTETITFNISTADPNYDIVNERWTISPATDLPLVTNASGGAIIDATSQPGAADYRIILDGQGTLTNGLMLQGPSEVYGMWITNFAGGGIYYGGFQNGPAIFGASGKGNLLNNNNYGIYLYNSSNITIQSNQIGTDPTGLIAAPNNRGIFADGSGVASPYVQGHQIGGSLVSERNIISGNTNEGIFLWYNNGAVIEGNWIGVDATGNAPLPNNEGIVHSIGINATIQNNVISANTTNGLYMARAENNDIYGNLFGVGSDGSTSLGNDIGIYFEPTGSANLSNTIGASGGNENTISNNATYGIQISNGYGNQVIANSISCNGTLGIDLNGLANNSILPPYITSTTSTSVSGTGVIGEDVHIYRANSGCWPYQGEEYLGTSVVDGAGNWMVTGLTIDVVNDYITATATNTTDGTSEFSPVFLDPPGHALDFDGVDDYIEIAQNTNLDGFSEMTVEAWVYRNDANTGMIAAVYNTNVSFDNYYLNFPTDDPTIARFALVWEPGGVNDRLYVDTDIIIPVGEWTHLAGVWHGGMDIRIYVNGVDHSSAVSGTTPAASLTDTAVPLTLGANRNVSGTLTGFINAQLDEVRLWDAARSAIDIQNNVMNTLAGNETNLIAYYKFDEGIPNGDNTTPPVNNLVDITANGNDGTLNNFTLNGPASNWVSSAIFTPFTPSNLFVTEISPTQIDLSWADNSFNETGFTIERSDGNNSNFVVIGSVGPDVTTFSDNTVVASNGYYYRIIANGTLTDSNPSNEKFGSTILPPGHALQFDGIDDIVDFGDVDFSSFNALTVETWIKPAYIPSGPSGETATILGKGATGGTGTSTFALVLEGDGGGPQLFALVDNGSTIEVARYDGGSFNLSADEWVHVAFTWSDGSPVRLYVNGTEVDATSNLSGPLNIVPNSMLLGSSTDINEIEYEGELDEIRIWNTERSSTEIQDNMYNTLIGNEAGLTMYYRFDQGIPNGDNTTPPIDLLPDRSILNNNGTLSNFTLNGLTSNWVDSYAMIEPFEVSYTIPNANAINVSANTDIEINFALTTGADNGDFNVYSKLTGLVTGTLTIDDKVFNFLPDNPFPPGDIITVTIGPNAESFSGTTLDRAYTYKFNITANSGPDTPDYFVESPTTIVSNSVDAQAVVAIDLDGDGDLDIASAGESDNKIIWFENDGFQHFTEHVISTNANQATDVFVIDLDSDGDMDMLSSSQGDNKIAWYENDGSQNFAEHVVDASASQAEAIFATDLDGDSDIDILTALPGSGEVVWYNNDGSQNFARTIIDNSLGSPRDIYAADINQDGFLDIITADLFNDEVYWLENDGVENFTSHTVITAAPGYGPWGVYAWDFDLDGDTDIFSSAEFSDEIAWYENDGTNSFIPHSITSNADGVRAFRVLDIDADGDLDVATASDNDNKIAWFENNGSFVFTEHVVTTNAGSARGVDVADMDNDGDLDLLSGAQTNDEIAWYRNNLNEPEISIYQGNDNTGTLIVDAQASPIDFGNVLQGTDLSQTFTIENSGSLDLTISNISVSGSDYSVTSSITTITTGTFETFTVTLSGINTGTFNTTITIDNNDSDENPFTFNITGIVVPPEPEINIYVGTDNTGSTITDAQFTAIDVGSSVQGTDITQTFAIENTGSADLNISNITVSGTDYSVASVIATITTGATETFTVTLSGSNTGTYTSSVTIDNNDADENPFTFDLTGIITTTPEPEINVYVGTDNTGAPIADAQTSAIDLGSIIQGTDIIQSFAIENTGTADLNISSISVSGTDYSITSAITAIATGITETFTVTLSGASTGTFAATVTIDNDDTDENPFTFDLTGVITATPEPEINVFVGADNTGTAIADAQATAIDFGSAEQGTDITRTFAIENIGADDLVISGISVDGTDYSIASSITTIAVGVTETFAITLSGTNLGAFNSVVTINNNDSNEDPFTFDITGSIESVIIIDGEDNNGVVVISNQTIDLGSTTVNVNIDKTFVIENPSTSNTLSINSISSDNLVFEIINPPASIPPSSFDQFIVRMLASDAGSYSGNVLVSTNLNDFTFVVSGEVLEENTGDLHVYNVVTPNGDGVHDFLKIGNITNYPGNKVIIYNRWGDKVFEAVGYDNQNVVFDGNGNIGSKSGQTTGNFYYSIDKGNGDKPLTGFIFLKR